MLPPRQVTVYTIDSSPALLERLESLQARIIEGNVRLIILDSVAALARRVGARVYARVGGDSAARTHVHLDFELAKRHRPCSPTPAEIAPAAWTSAPGRISPGTRR